ncbi:MAG: peroxiredoxin [Candidatus Niyogibacteria bacterium]|nr:peroxiredoxin [Candidatus Niyogibacteria bacterium]
MIKVGQEVPDFKLQGYADGKFKDYSLKDFKNKWLVIFFYPLDFTFVCPTEIREFSEHESDFKKAGAEVVGVSVDSVYSHKAWVEGGLGKIKFPLLSDFQKRMSEDYEVLLEEEGIALRGTFIVDPKGKLRYMVISDNDVGRSVKETLRVLKALQTGKLCPVEWAPGKKTLN